MKRLFDFIFSFISLVMLLPFLLLISIWIMIDSRGGIIYTQRRVGRNNSDFNILKFRSMHPDSDSKGLLTVGGRDPRVTGAGYYLRKVKMDELPQLVNILKGDMSFVGPRPEVRKYVDMYNEKQMKVLNVQPGLTDYASLEYFEENKILEESSDPEKDYIETIMPAKLELNLKYIEDQSFITDIRIILRTISKIIQ